MVNPVRIKFKESALDLCQVFLNINIYDEVLPVKSNDAMETAREIAKKEGILVGISSGAALFAAIEVAKKMTSDQKVLVLLPDNGERYLSTELFQFNQ